MTIILHAPWWPTSFEGWLFLAWVLYIPAHTSFVMMRRRAEISTERDRETTREIYERATATLKRMEMRQLADPARNFESIVVPETGITLQDFMQLKPAPKEAQIAPPAPGTPFDWRADPRFESSRKRLGKTELEKRLKRYEYEMRRARREQDTLREARLPVSDPTDVNAREQGGPTHSEWLAQQAAEKLAREAELRRAPYVWRCDVCGHTEILTGDELALREDGLGDLWKSHWPAKAEGAAADVLCPGRVIRIGVVAR